MQAKESLRENSDGGASFWWWLLLLLCNISQISYIYWIEISLRTKGETKGNNKTMAQVFPNWVWKIWPMLLLEVSFVQA